MIIKSGWCGRHVSARQRHKGVVAGLVAVFVAEVPPIAMSAPFFDECHEIAVAAPRIAIIEVDVYNV